MAGFVAPLNASSQPHQQEDLLRLGELSSLSKIPGGATSTQISDYLNEVRSRINQAGEDFQSELWGSLILSVVCSEYECIGRGAYLHRWVLALLRTAKKMPEGDLRENMLTSLFTRALEISREVCIMRREIIFSLVWAVLFFEPSELRQRLWLSLLESELRFLDEDTLSPILRCASSEPSRSLWFDFLDKLPGECLMDYNLSFSVMDAATNARLDLLQRSQIVERIPEALQQNEEVSRRVETFIRPSTERRASVPLVQVFSGVGCFTTLFICVGLSLAMFYRGHAVSPPLH